jgi:amino acid transporter
MHFFPFLIEWELKCQARSNFWMVPGTCKKSFSRLAFIFQYGLKGAPGTGDGHKVNLIVMVVCLVISGLLTLGIKGASKFNSLMVIIKLAIILIIIAVGNFYIDSANGHPFMPFGFEGIMSGEALVFFTVFGYDTLTTSAEESKNPQRDLPRAVFISLTIALCLYIGISLASLLTIHLIMRHQSHKLLVILD